MTRTAYQSISAAVLALGIAATATILPSFSDRVVASAPIHTGKGDRLDIRPLGAKCSANGWPYFESTCLRDRRAGDGKARQVRVVAVDRLR